MWGQKQRRGHEAHLHFSSPSSSPSLPLQNQHQVQHDDVGHDGHARRRGPVQGDGGAVQLVARGDDGAVARVEAMLIFPASFQF